MASALEDAMIMIKEKVQQFLSQKQQPLLSPTAKPGEPLAPSPSPKPRLLSPVDENYGKPTPVPIRYVGQAQAQQPQFRTLKDVQEFVQIAKPIFEQYGIPMQVAMGQFAAEGRLDGMGAKRNNFYNIGAFDSNPRAAMRYQTPEEGIEAYAKLLSGKYTLQNGRVENRYQPAYELRNDPAAMIRMIEQAGYAGDPKTYGRRANNGFRSYSDFVMATPEWNAQY